MTHRRACSLVAVLGCAAALPVMLYASDNRPSPGVEIMVKCADARPIAEALRVILPEVPRGSRLRVDVDPR